MPDPQDNQQIEGLPPGAVLKPIQQSAPQIEGLPAGAVLKPIGGATTNQPMVTNTAGETMPADVAARHALTRADKPPDEKPVVTPWTPAVNAISDVGSGFAREAAKTGIGAARLIAGPEVASTVAPEDLETHGVAQNIGAGIEQVGEWMTGDEALEGLAKLGKVAKNAPHLIELIENYPKAAKILMATAKGAAIGGAQGAVKESAPGGKGAIEGGKEGAEGGGAGGAIGETIGMVAKPILKSIGIGTSSVEDAIRAAQPGKRNDKFIGDWALAKDRIANEIKESGKFTDIQDAADRIGEVRKDIWNKEVAPAIQAHANEIVDTTPVAKAVRDLADPSTKAGKTLAKNFPEDAKKLNDFANKYTSGSPLFDGDRSVEEIEQEIELYNAKLSDKGFWKKTASERAAMVKANPEIGAWITASDAMRDALYDHLETKSGVPGMKDLKKTYGAMANVEREIRGQVNVASRAKPLSMKQIIGLTAGIVHGGPAGWAAAALPILDRIYNSPEELLNRAASKAVPPGPVKQAVQKVAKTVAPVTKNLPAMAGENLVLMMGPDGKAVDMHPDDVDKAKQMGYKPVESTPEKP